METTEEVAAAHGRTPRRRDLAQKVATTQAARPRRGRAERTTHRARAGRHTTPDASVSALA